jgi:hypothetical protein
VSSTKPKLHPKEMIFVADFGNESFSKKKKKQLLQNFWISQHEFFCWWFSYSVELVYNIVEFSLEYFRQLKFDLSLPLKKWILGCGIIWLRIWSRWALVHLGLLVSIKFREILVQQAI